VHQTLLLRLKRAGIAFLKEVFEALLQMKASDQSRARRVTTRAEIAALDHPMRSRLLMACVRHERNLTELARELDQPLGKLHYHMGRLTGSGLLAVGRIEQRPGRPIRYYRAVAKAFLISLADVREPMADKWARELRQSLTQQYTRRNLSLLYDLNEAGRYRVRLIDSDGRGQASRNFEAWKVVRLTNQQRRSLADELRALISRYDAMGEGSGRETFIVHAAFAPKIWDV
jgi:hypothetical protein